MIHRVALAFTVLLSSAPASAQAPPADDPGPQTDLIDVWQKIRGRTATEESRQERRVMVAIAPVIGANPTFGATFGVAAQIALRLGDDTTTRLSSSVSSLTFSTKGQTLLNVRYSVFTEGNRWFVEGDNRFYISGQDVYPLGSSAPASSGVPSKYRFLRLHDTLYRHVGNSVYVGGGLAIDSHTHIRPSDEAVDAWPGSAFIGYSTDQGLPTDSQQSAGLTAGVRIDRRKGEINPEGGWMSALTYRSLFADFLGGDSAWQGLRAEYRGYAPFGAKRRQRLAVWLVADVSSNDAVTYFDLPETVSDVYARSARGYQEGRFRGERMVYGEAEYRATLTRNGLLGMVAFVNVTTVTNVETGEQLFEDTAPAAGAGVRVLLNKRSRTNLCLDIAWGKSGSRGVYFALQEAF